jgi:hypothetical protein
MALVASALTDWIGAGAAVLTVAFASLVVFQLLDIKKQTRQSALAGVSQSYAQVSERMWTLRNSLFEHPGWVRDFYENVRADGVPKDVATQLEMLCEEIVDFADALIEQRNTIPGADMDWSTWDVYFRYLYQHSPLLRTYLRVNRTFYPDYVLTAFGYVIARDEQSGVIRSEWSVYEWQPDLADDRVEEAVARCLREGEHPDVATAEGFPWFRTWAITRIDDDRDDTQVPRLVAVTRAGPSDGRQADVRIAWCGAPDEDATPVLQSWVLSVLRGSSVLTTATLSVEGDQAFALVQLQPSRRWERKPESSLRERFLAPTFVTLRWAR